MIATLEDLKFEQFIRNRNNGTLIWKTKSGEIIPIKDLSTEHLNNIINISTKHSQKTTKISARSLNFY